MEKEAIKRQRKFIACDTEKCTGCRICDLVCSSVKEEKFNPLLSRIHTVRIGIQFNISIACRLCEDAPCVQVCPRKALMISEENGTIIVDENKCIGCGWCIEACPFGAITPHTDKKAVVICDLCGVEPKCVEFCPKGALTLTTPHVIENRMRVRAVKKLELTHSS